MAEDDYNADEYPSDGSAVSDFNRKLKGWVKQDLRHAQEWRKEAREDFGVLFRAISGRTKDRQALASQMRPALMFNRIAPRVNAVVGSEINNRREVRYIPREQGDALANEVPTAAGEWFQRMRAEDEESDAFEDAVICGMGWTDTRLDFEVDPDGAPVIERMDPLEIVWTVMRPSRT